MQRTAFALLALLLGLASCSEPAETGYVSDERNPGLKQAAEELQRRNYAAAAECYEKAAQLNPTSQRAHWEAAMLYEQHLNDYASAIFHYQRFIALKPEPARVKMAREFIERAKYSLATSLPNTPLPGASEFSNLEQKNKALQDEVDKLRQRLAEAEMKLANRPEVAANAAPPPPLDPPTGAPQTTTQPPAKQTTDKAAGNGPPLVGTVGSGGPIPVATAKTKPASLPKNYTVKRGDTLAGIAAQLYGDRNAWPVIYRANKSAIPDKDHLLVGTVLTIPARSSR